MNNKELKHYIYMLKLSDPSLNEDVNWTDEQNKIVEEHFAYLKNLINNNVLIMAGRTIGEDIFGIVLFRAETKESALEIMNRDPAVQKKLMTTELHEFSLALLNTSL